MTARIVALWRVLHHRCPVCGLLLPCGRGHSDVRVPLGASSIASTEAIGQERGWAA